MSRTSAGQATELLRRMGAGDGAAGSELLPILYRELHAIAARMMSEQGHGHTLQATALVHEAYLRLVGEHELPGFESRAHFLGVAAKAMRSVLVDHARRRAAGKRPSGDRRLTLSEVDEALDRQAIDLVAIDEALTRLDRMDADLARIVELRFFAGLSVEETARALAVSETTVVRGWRIARMWLRRELAG